MPSQKPAEFRGFSCLYPSSRCPRAACRPDVEAEVRASGPTSHVVVAFEFVAHESAQRVAAAARVDGAHRDDSDDIVGQVDIGAPRAPRAPGSVIRFCRRMPRPAPSHDRRDGGVGRVALRGPTGREVTATCERERRHASRCCTGRRGKRPLPSEDRAGRIEPRTGVRWSLCRGRPPSMLRVRTNCQRRRCLIPCSGLSQFLGLPCQFL